ncbi:hypothetical protein [Corynebacterium imitans]|nr:hypothetical protein [Corynebacterium imitans]AIJ33447.1 hypothetical protein CIMIT_05610 [Corynebacterium imitans]
MKEYIDGEPRPDTSCLIHTHDGKYLGIMHGADAHLAAAAPDLAETIAGMEYEYTVQVMDETGGWAGIDKNGLATHDHGLMVWNTSQRAMRQSLLDLVEQAADAQQQENHMTNEFILAQLRRLAAGKKLQKHQLAELERDGLICTTDDDQIHLTTHGARMLRERN